MKAKANYGIDSPYIIAGESIIGVILIGLTWVYPHLFGLPARWIGLAAGLLLLSSAAGMMSYSKSGKLRIRDQVLESIPWNGDEMVLDLGCGRGLLLVGAARRLNAIKWTVVERMVWAWILTIPVTALLAYAFVRALRAMG